MTDDQVLEFTEHLHDCIDMVVGETVARRAEMGSEISYEIGTYLRKNRLTQDQLTEVRALQIRMYTVCLNIATERAEQVVALVARRA